MNENCGGNFSLKISRETGEKYKKLGIGVCGMTYEQRKLNGIKSGLKTKDLKIGIHGLSTEQLSEAGKKGGLSNKENKTGVCGLDAKQLRENVKKTNSQKWMCLETGFITNSGSLSRYQKSRNINTNKRLRIE